VQRTYAHVIEGAGRAAVRGIDEQLTKANANRGGKKPKIAVIRGAGGGNRTRDSCLEGKGITIMQRPQTTAFCDLLRNRGELLPGPPGRV
jgi:hypothetical protein